MEKEELKALSREEVKNYITGIWKSLWDGSAGNAYVSVEVLGSTVEEVKEALVTLVKEENSEVIDMLVSNNLWLHEDCAKDDGCVRMAYWKGGIDFAYKLSKVLPGTIVVCEDGGWYGVNECIVAIKGNKAVPGKDYTGVMEYSSESDHEDDEDDDEESYFTVELKITDKKGNTTYAGGGMISEEYTEKYKMWANKIYEKRNDEKTQYIVKAYEEELGEELFIVNSNKSKAETMEILSMAARYSTMDIEMEVEEGIAEYDEYYEEIRDNDECGLYKFQQYVKLRGLEIKALEYDFEFEW